MRTLDKLLTQARLLRIARAQRTQAAIARRAAASGGSMTAGADVDGSSDWVAECALAHGILAELASSEIPEDRRRTRALGVLDMSTLGPFVDEAVAALLALIEARRPQDAVVAALWPEVCRHVAPFVHPEPEAFDAGRVRRAAVQDVAVLAVEDALFEVLRAVIEANDAKRAVAIRPDLPPIVVGATGVRRAVRPQAAEEVEAARMAGVSALSTPVAAIAAAGGPSKPTRPPTRAQLRTEAKARRLAREAAAGLAVAEDAVDAGVAS